MNDSNPISVTDGGIVINFKDEQLSNELSPIVVTESGIDISINDEHS